MDAACRSGPVLPVEARQRPRRPDRPDRPGGPSGEAAPGAGSGAESANDPDAVIRCRACGEPVTRRTWAISVRGGHEHTVFNPAGLVFHIGCFREAPGIHPFGPRSTEFSWFPGHAWTVGACAGCGRHLGWLFLVVPGEGPDAEDAPPVFHGLILDRLMEGPDGG